MSDRNPKNKSDEEKIFRCKQCGKIFMGLQKITQHKREAHPEFVQSVLTKTIEAPVRNDDASSISNQLQSLPEESCSVPDYQPKGDDEARRNVEMATEKPALEAIEKYNSQTNNVPETFIPEIAKNSPEVIDLVSSSDNSSRESSPEAASISCKPNTQYQEIITPSQSVLHELHDVDSTGPDTLLPGVSEKVAMDTTTVATENMNLEIALKQQEKPRAATNVSIASLPTLTVTTRFKCSVCAKFFPTTGALRMHMARHPKQRKQRGRKIKCRYCHQTFSTAINRDTHESYDHPDALHFLAKRNGSGRGRPKKTRRNSDENVVDLTDRENFLPFKCTECKESFAKERLLSQHMRTHSMYQCALCKDQFEREFDFKAHLKKHLPKKRKRPVFKQTSFLTYRKDFYEKEVKEPEDKPADMKLKLFKVPVLQTPSEKHKSAVYWSTSSIPKSTPENKDVYDFAEDSLNCDIKPLLHTPSPVPSNASMLSTPEMPSLSRQGSIEKNPVEITLSTDIMKPTWKNWRSKPRRRRFECNLCKRTFRKSASLVRHFRNHFSKSSGIHQPEGRVECPACEKNFNIKASLYVHCRKVHGKSIRELRKTSESLISLQTSGYPGLASASVDENASQGAGDCPNQVMSLLYPQLEISIHPDSAFSSASGRSLTSGTPKRRVVKRHSCTVCGKCFNLRSSFEKHQQVHDRPFPCELCEKAFNTESQLESHRSASHEITEMNTLNTFHCDQCKKSFKSKCSLSQHLKTHEKPFSCSICEKRFSTKQQLKLHVIKFHKKPFQCNSSPMAGKFECNFCARVFKYQSQLDWHSKTHSKPFACDQCGRDFADEEKLDRHVHLKHPNTDLATSVHDSSDDLINSGSTEEIERQQSVTLEPLQVPVGVVKKIECPTCFQNIAAGDQYNNHMLQHLTNPYNIPLQL